MKRFAAGTAVVLGALASVTAAQAGNTTISNVTVPVNFGVFVPCANGGVGENVDFSGSIHAIFRTTVNGNRVSVFQQQNLAGVTGTGETTGTTFQSTGSISEVDSGDFTNGPAVFRFQNAAHFVSQGSESNWLIHEIGNFVVNADGTVTVNFDNFNIDCT
jgi:hypothetical protein